MAKLPVIPKKQFTINSKYLQKGKINLVPFNVGQENILLQVKDAEDEKEKLEAIRQVVSECVVTPGVDVDYLPMFLVEEIFLRLRQNSIGELIDQVYQCTNEIDADGTPCNKTIPIQIDLREFKIVEPEGHTNTIVLADPIGVRFKYPSLSTIEDAASADEVDNIISCIDIIYDDENVYPASENTKEELVDFWSQLTLLQKKEVFDKFFNTMPHMYYKKELQCPSCGHNHVIEFSNVQEVFQ